MLPSVVISRRRDAPRSAVCLARELKSSIFDVQNCVGSLTRRMSRVPLKVMRWEPWLKMKTRLKRLRPVDLAVLVHQRIHRIQVHTAGQHGGRDRSARNCRRVELHTARVEAKVSSHPCSNPSAAARDRSPSRALPPF